MLESKFQRNLINELTDMFPGSVVLKNDAQYKPGFPDLIILYEDRWACLECKASSNAAERPNQAFYVDFLNEMSYAAFIHPENKERVLDEVQQALRA